ncbi:MCE family protein [Jongsikchunia kroppenstedtii]|uniref:MCE family protein n=1 Tax=Jongsikchunia kroppenstedtii TaxID=1121721 RepID=UPI00039F07EE|nr:MlaD family protein [Jongsikchunia kroppenstedtii]
MQPLMEKLTRPIRHLVDPPSKSVAQETRGEIYWGVAMVIVGVVAALVVGGLYVFSPGTYKIKADFNEAGLIQNGASVRVAGIQVGTVKKISLKSDHVEVDMAVNNGTWIGDQSSAEVKMLTIVGGNYIDITPMGTKKLGKNHIPATRTSVPYSLMETFQSITPKLSQVDATPLRDTLSQLQTGFSENPGAIKQDLTVMQSMLLNLNRNQDNFGAMLKMAAEYTSSLNNNGAVITNLISNLSYFITSVSSFSDRWQYMFDHLTDFLARLGSVLGDYQTDVDPLVRQVDDIGRQFGPLMARYTPMIDQARDLITRLENSVQPDGSVVINGQTVLTSNFCIPQLGVKC